MSGKPSRGKTRKREARFVSCLRDFLSPALFRQVNGIIPQRFRGERRRRSRWTVQPLLFVLLCMTWCAGDSQPERFETARGFYVACHEKRRRPGKTFVG